MAAFRSTAAVDPHVVIVFDSHLPGLREPEYRDGVELVYAEAGVTADEVIVEMAGAFTRPTVVVSSDRDVREGAEASRALTLWAEALGEWLG